MSQVIQAIYENGVLKPTEPLNLPEKQQVQVTVEAVESKAESNDDDPLAGLRVELGKPDLSERLDDYRFGALS